MDLASQMAEPVDQQTLDAAKQQQQTTAHQDAS